MAPKWPHAGTAVPPALVPLGENQYTTSQLSNDQADRYMTKIRDPSNLVKGQNCFPLPPKKPGASHFAVQAVTSLVNILITYSMLSVETEGKVQLLA